MKIRHFRQDDITILKKIFFKSVPEYFAAHEWDEFVSFVKKESCPYHLIEDDRSIVGSFGYAMDTKTTGAIVWIFFDADKHGKGYGRAALEYCHKGIKNAGGLKVITRTSQKTKGFFAKLGYSTTKHEKDYWAQGLDLVVMERAL